MWDQIKHYAGVVWDFLSSRIFLVNFAKMAAIAVISFFMIFKLLSCYTRHGDKAKVDKYIGSSLEEARTKAESAGFDVAVSDSVFLVGQRPDMVTAQNPAPNAEVKEGRTIYLTITKAIADLATLPALSGGNDDYNFYAKKLEMMGITARILRKETDAQLEEGTIKDVIVDGKSIVDQLASGYKAPMGSAIDFVVSQREGDDAVTPDLSCKTADETSFLLQASQLTLGKITADASVTNQNTAYVVGQDPQPGVKVKKNQPVNVTLSQTKPVNCADASGGQQ